MTQHDATRKELIATITAIRHELAKAPVRAAEAAYGLLDLNHAVAS